MNLCQPDENKSCSACCGLINHSDISRKYLSNFLEGGKFRTENYWRYQIEGCYPEQTASCRDYSSHICPYNGFMSRGRPGCLIHPLYAGEEQRDLALFGAAACDNFSCPAYEIFNDEIKTLLIDSISDWYVYTIAIIDPFSTIWIIEQIYRAGIIKKMPEFENALNASLIVHGAALAKYTGTIFCYSMEEYDHEGRKFSLNTDDVRSQIDQHHILQIIKENIRM